MPDATGLMATGSFYARAMNIIPYEMLANTTPVVLTNPTAATDLMTFTVPTNPNGNGCIINKLGAGFLVYAQGNINLAAASTLVFTVKLGTVTIATITTASQTNTAVVLNWQLDLDIITSAVGSSGTVEAHGKLFFDSGATLAAAASVFQDSITAASAAIDLTQNPVLEVMANLGSGNASSTVTARVLRVILIQ